MKKVFILLAVFWLAAVGWAITPSTTNNDNSVTTDLEFIQDLSPPLVIINLNTNETTFTAVAAKSVMNSILPSPNWGESFNANETANYANANEERLMAVAAVHVMKIVQSPNTGYFNNNTTANTASTTARRINADKWIIFKLC